jgi:hypothetical protein
MVTYRCFILDKESHIRERLSIETDDDALIRAVALLGRRPDMSLLKCGTEQGWCRSCVRSKGSTLKTAGLAISGTPSGGDEAPVVLTAATKLAEGLLRTALDVQDPTNR